MSPYQILTVGSLVQREATPEDFAKVARVIYNRLAENRTLEFDSTVNYPLDRIEVATTDGDRGQHTPWNTYVRPGLPATPICSPGQPALAAAEKPEPGDWLYFVTIDMQGTTLFTRDYQQHLANIELAKRNGVLDSAAVAPRKAAVLGSPIAHSRSPQLHLAAYRALGLDGWSYERIECTAEQLPTLVGGFGPEWVGVSVTMPGKFAALRFADERTPRAELVGSANTLVRSADGMAGRQHRHRRRDGRAGPAVSGHAIVVGSGGTAPAVVVGLAELGVQRITVVARNREKAAPLVDLAASSVSTADGVTSTVPN